MSKVSELNKLAQKITGQNPKENTIREILDEISTFFKGSSVKSSNTEKAIKNVTENYSGGGGLDWSEIGYEETPQTIINGFDYAKTIYDNWDVSTTNMSDMFKNDRILSVMPLIDTQNVTNMNGAFRNCQGIDVMPQLNTENVTTMCDTFRECTRLAYLPVLDTRSIGATMFLSVFSGCTSLSNESLNNIMRMCINATGVNSSYKTLKWVGLSETQATTCQGLSNYADFTAAGWTTGY